jgi:hypothetical protein
MSSPAGSYKPNISPDVTYEKSLAFKAVSCTPLIGIVSSYFSTATLAAKHDQSLKRSDINGRISILTAFKESRKIELIRNVLSIALIVGAVACGILSNPVGITLASFFCLSAVYDVCQFRRCNRLINNLMQK